MGKTILVDYENMRSRAQKMKTCGETVRTQLRQAYRGVEDMHNCWYGERYNSLIKEFNTKVSDLNVCLRVLINKFPNTLEKISRKYLKADTIVGVIGVLTSSEKFEGITKNSTYTGKGIKFLANEVRNRQNEISKNLKNAIDQINQMQAVSGKIDWTSEASKSYENKFKNLTNKIIEEIKKLDTQFNETMNKALEEIESTEKTNITLIQGLL